ncbi:hypothetical protein BS78_K245100 [Paspalum vaginatum]|uniref:Uncharacterized protein n=1 Tax=Paspalum vaginatum TaxID=158149 RepID=A0A9W7X8R2_9POAL|nr:hypothetical protein BS78_K245100 [Paspalum vaginatum]
MGYSRMPIRAGMVPPMCFCGDPCKMEASDEEETYRRRYWMYGNWAFDPPEKAVLRGVLEPPPLCDFEEWIDTEVKEFDRQHLQGCKEFDAEIKRSIALRKKEEAAREKLAEERCRAAATRKAKREVKLARATRAKAAQEEDLDALRKGKWPRCTQ